MDDTKSIEAAQAAEAEAEARLVRLAKLLISEVGNSGFFLLVFDRDRTRDGEINYLSNNNRRTTIAAMKEFIAREEGSYHKNPGGKQ